MELEPRTIGRPTREREMAGAAVLIAGALAVALMAALGQPFYRDLVVLGAVAVVAWLVDGTSRRYLGPGLIAMAVGLGLTIGQDFGVKNYEHTLVYGGIGVALLIAFHFNPLTVRAGAALLIYTGVTVSFSTWVFRVPIGWELTAILAVWGAFQFVRLGRSEPDAPAQPTIAPQRAPEMSGRR